MRYAARCQIFYSGDFEAISKRYQEYLQENLKQSNPDLYLNSLFNEHRKTFVFDSEETDPEVLRKEAARVGGFDLDRLVEHSQIFLEPVPFRTIRELLSAPVVHVVYDLIPVEDVFDFPVSDLWKKMEEDKRVEVRYYVYHCSDGNRGWYLKGLFFDNRPVLLYQSAGRGGRDFSRCFMISYQAFLDLQSYVQGLREPREEHREVPLDEERDDLTSFYGQSFADIYPLENGHKVVFWKP